MTVLNIKTPDAKAVRTTRGVRCKRFNAVMVMTSRRYLKSLRSRRSHWRGIHGPYGTLGKAFSRSSTLWGGTGSPLWLWDPCSWLGSLDRSLTGFSGDRRPGPVEMRQLDLIRWRFIVCETARNALACGCRQRRARGGIGIRVRLRSVCRKTWEFESPRAHPM